MTKANQIKVTEQSQLFSTLKLRHNKQQSAILRRNVDHSMDAGQLFVDLIGNEAQEHLVAVYADVHLNVIGYATISIGNNIQSVADVRSIFTHALLCNANSIFIGHNHPSGNLTLSKPDLDTFKRLNKAGKLLDMVVLDLFAVNDHDFRSVRELQNDQKLSQII